jgi:CIC family chloride channel protein
VTLAELWKNSLLKRLLKDEASEEKTYFALTIATGLFSALAAVALQTLTYDLTKFLGTGGVFTLRTFILGGLAVLISGYLTTRHYPSTSGSGIPGVRLALAVFHGKITFRSTIAKFVVTVLSLSSGMSLGREGPTVTIASGIGSALGNFFHLSKKKIKALVAIGAAGWISAVFQTPITAVIFTLEEVVGDLNAKILGSIIISSVLASVTAQAVTGNSSFFREITYHLNSPKELIFYLIIGVIAAIIGPLWVRCVLQLRKTNSKLFRGHKLTVMMVTFFLMGAFSFIHPAVLGGGHSTIESALLSLILDWRVLLSIFALKFIASAICYSSGISGGLYMPVLLMGATLGSLVAAISQLYFPEIILNPGSYALVGMGALFVSIIRAPFTSIILAFELTRNYSIILPIMIANIAALWISSKIHSHSVYESISEQDGIHLPTREDHEILEGLLVEDAMIYEPICLPAHLSVDEAMKFAKSQPYSGYPILRNGLLEGVVSASDLATAIAKGDGHRNLLDVAEKKVITIHPDQSLLVAFHKLNRFQVSRLPVVSRINDKKVVGIITAENIVSKFGYHLKDDNESNLESLESRQQEKQDPDPSSST